MDKCFIKKLNAVIDNADIPYYNSTALAVGDSGSDYNLVRFRLTNGTAKVKVEKGILSLDGAQIAKEGDIITIHENGYRVTTPFALRFLDNDDLTYLNCYFNAPTYVEVFADFKNFEELYGTGINLHGRLEDYVEKATENGKTSPCIFGSNNITFNGRSTNAQSFKVTFNNGVANVLDHKNNDVLLGTYNLAKDIWVYK